MGTDDGHFEDNMGRGDTRNVGEGRQSDLLGVL